MFFTPTAKQSAAPLPGGRPSVCLHKSTSGAALRVERGSQIARRNVAEQKKKKKNIGRLLADRTQPLRALPGLERGAWVRRHVYGRASAHFTWHGRTKGQITTQRIHMNVVFKENPEREKIVAPQILSISKL